MKNRLLSFFILLFFSGNSYGKQDSFYHTLSKVFNDPLGWWHERCEKQESNRMHNKAILLLHPLLQEGGFDEKTCKQFQDFCHYAGQSPQETESPFKYLLFKDNEKIKALHEIIEKSAPSKRHFMKFKRSDEQVNVLVAQYQLMQQIRMLDKEKFEKVLLHSDESKIFFYASIYYASKKEFEVFLKKAMRRLVFLRKKGFPYFDHESYIKKRKKWFDICAQIIGNDNTDEFMQLSEKYKQIRKHKKVVGSIKPSFDKKYGDLCYMDAVDKSIGELTALDIEIRKMNDEEILNMLKAIENQDGNKISEKCRNYILKVHPDKYQDRNLDAALFRKLKEKVKTLDEDEREKFKTNLELSIPKIESLKNDTERALKDALLYQADYKKRAESCVPIRRFSLVNPLDLIIKAKRQGFHSADPMMNVDNKVKLYLEYSTSCK